MSGSSFNATLLPSYATNLTSGIVQNLGFPSPNTTLGLSSIELRSQGHNKATTSDRLRGVIYSKGPKTPRKPTGKTLKALQQQVKEQQEERQNQAVTQGSGRIKNRPEYVETAYTPGVSVQIDQDVLEVVLEIIEEHFVCAHKHQKCIPIIREMLEQKRPLKIVIGENHSDKWGYGVTKLFIETLEQIYNKDLKILVELAPGRISSPAENRDFLKDKCFDRLSKCVGIDDHAALSDKEWRNMNIMERESTTEILKAFAPDLYKRSIKEDGFLNYPDYLVSQAGGYIDRYNEGNKYEVTIYNKNPQRMKTIFAKYEEVYAKKPAFLAHDFDDRNRVMTERFFEEGHEDFIGYLGASHICVFALEKKLAASTSNSAGEIVFLYTKEGFLSTLDNDLCKTDKALSESLPSPEKTDL